MGTTEIYNLHDPMFAHHHVVELQIPMCEPHAVEIRHTAQNLEEATADFLTRHLARHNNGKEVKRRVFHDLVPLSLLLHNVERLNDIAVVQRGPHAVLGCQLLHVLALRLVRVARSELLDGKHHLVLGAPHKAHRPARSCAQDLAELAVLGREPVVVAKRHLRRLGGGR